MKVKEKLEGGPLYDLVLMDFGNNLSVEQYLLLPLTNVHFIYFHPINALLINPQPTHFHLNQFVSRHCLTVSYFIIIIIITHHTIPRHTSHAGIGWS